ncbi:MAG: hypothetical protein RL522_2558 [Pseudomonadota bacterium]|jgi:hypothetical protein
MRLAHSPPRAACRPLWWTATLTLLVVEALAFYLLCAQQVQRAEVRRALSQSQDRAFSDCLAYVSGSTIASCSRHLRRAR